MAGADEPGEFLWRAIGGKRCEQIDAVVTPAAPAWKSREGHQLQVRDAELGQIRQLALRCCVRAFGRKGSEVKLVNDGVAERPSMKFSRHRLQRLGRNDMRCAMHTLRLPTRSRIGHGCRSVNGIAITAPRIRGNIRLPIAVSQWFKRESLFPQNEIDALRIRRPNGKDHGESRISKATGNAAKSSAGEISR